MSTDNDARVQAFVRAWKDVILLAIATISVSYGSYTFFVGNFYTKDDLQATAIGDVDTRLPASQQDRISLRLAVVNAGTGDAGVLQAAIVPLRKEDDGYAWVRIFPPIGEGFEAKVLKPGEIVILSLVTGGHAQDYFTDPNYSRRIDGEHHEFVEAVRIKSMDSKGHIYSVLYPIWQFKIRNDYQRGPTEGWTFDRRTHQLLVNTGEKIPPLAKEYNDELP